MKNVKVSWEIYIPNIWKNKKCSKPPTKYIYIDIDIEIDIDIDST